MSRLVPTTVGEARVSYLGARSGRLLVVGHGAGGGIDAADLVAAAAAAQGLGWRVALVEQPWRVAGRKVAPRPATLDAAWRDVVRRLRFEDLVVAGRSAGARVACRTALELGARAVIAPAFPLHPPGRPEASRADELTAAGVPTTVIQGTVDPFGSPVEVRRAARGVRVRSVRGGDHRLVRPGDSTAARQVASAVADALLAVTA